jgi:hypothetical protein
MAFKSFQGARQIALLTDGKSCQLLDRLRLLLNNQFERFRLLVLKTCMQVSMESNQIFGSDFYGLIKPRAIPIPISIAIPIAIWIKLASR